MKNKKTVAIILYAIYAVALVLIITFGSHLGDGLVYKLENFFRHKNIGDVTVNIAPDTELLAGRDYYPQYTAHGHFVGSPGLRYTSLDPDYLSVAEDGKMRVSTDFDGEKIDVSLKLTSAYDEDFEKVFTFRFVKKYPSNFSVSYSVMGLGTDTGKLTVGVPVYVFSEIDKGEIYNVSDHTLIYDENYFTEGEHGSIVPTRATPEGVTLSFAVEYANGARVTSSTFRIDHANEQAKFDTVLLNGVRADRFVGVRGEDIELTLLSGDNEIATDYTLSFREKGDAKRNGKGGMYFSTAGDKEITVTLPNGYTQTVTTKIRNTVLKPMLSDPEAESTHVINVYKAHYETVNFYFDGDVTYDAITYEYDEEIMRFSATPRSFTIKPLRFGTTTLRLTIDDGYTKVTDEYTINIKRDPNLRYLISQDISGFVAKFFGHMALFAFLSLWSLNMFRYFYFDKKLLRFLLYTLTALPLAVITEVIQIFMEGRSAGFYDVLIDMAGFYLGTGALLLLCLIFRRIKERSRAKDTKDDETKTKA